MANATVNLSLTQSGYVKKSDPYTVFKTNTNTEYQISTVIDKLLYFCIPDIPSALRHNVLVGFSATFAIKCGTSYSNNVYMYGCNRFDPDELTFNNKPEPYNMSCRIESDQSGRLNNRTFPYKESGQATRSLLRLGGVVLELDAGFDNPNYQVWAKTVLEDGSTRPYITITYDDAVKIKSKVSYGSSQLTGTISNAVAKTLTWDLVKDTSAVSGYCADQTWNQESAVFKYRKQGESTWLTMNVSGSTKSITIPAGTFQSGASYEYQITVTDEDGTVSSTSVYTFTVAATSVTPSNAPTSGYANPRNPISFGWVYQSTAGGTIASGATTLHWRISGDEAWNDVQAAAGVNSLTIPANTFPTASTIQWYLSGSDSTGYASQTSVYSFSTSAGLVTATPVSPISTVESNNEEITLTWTYSSADGFAPSRFILYWKLITDDSWTVLTDSATAATSYTAPANTFTAGEIQWYVLPYNIDGVAGSGNSASFIAYGAPEAPVVSAEAVPFTKVSWQATGQEAYEVQVDEDTYGPYFGTEKQFVLPEKLEDGQHIIRVRIIGNYGLWSQYGTIIISITNSPGSSIKLSNTGNILPLFASFPTQDNPRNPTVTAQWSEDRQQASITGNTGAFGAELWLYGTEISVGGTIEDATPSCLRYDTPYTVSYETTDDNVSLYVTIGMQSMITTGGELTFSIPVGTNYMEMYLSIPRQTSVDATIKITMPDVVNPVEQMMIWETEEETDDYYVLRDGKTIGHTTEKEFHDRFASGKHVYQVINRLPSGNYSISNKLTLVTEADGAYIALLSGGEWLEIKYSKKDTRDPEYEVSADGSFYHLAGDEWPSGSLSGYKESKVIFSALFFREQETERQQFERMLGKAVILKFRDGTVFPTVLDNWKKEMKKLIWTAYSFTLRRIEWEDYTDDTE